MREAFWPPRLQSAPRLPGCGSFPEIGSSTGFLHLDVMRLIVEVDVELSFYETIDSVLEALNRLDGLLKIQADDLSEVVLAKLIEGGDVPELQRFLHGVKTDLAEAEKELLELEPTMGQVYRHVRKEGGS